MKKLTISKPKFTKFKDLKNLDFKTIIKNILSGKSLIVVLVVFFLALNVLSESYHVRLDLTENSRYSLSPATKEIINNLDENVIIKVYFSDNIPPNLSETKQNSLDIFTEYQKNSNGNVIVEIVDPTSATFEEDAITSGVRQIQFSELSEDSYAVAQGFFGAVITKGDEKEAISVISNTGNLEYETTSRIVKVSGAQQGKVGFLTGHGEKSINTDISQANEFLQTQFSTEEIDLSSGKPIDPEEFPVVVIASPTEAMSKRDRFELEQYTIRGGRLLILSDILQLQESTPILTKTESNINELLKLYGLEQETKVVLDESFTPVVSGASRIAYPYWVLITTDGFNSEIPPLSELTSATLLWTSPLKQIEDTKQTITQLLTTTDSAWTEEGDTLSIDFKNFSPENQGKEVLGYLVEGTLEKSFDSVPELKDSKEKDQRTKEDEVVDNTDQIKVVVIGDVDFITDNFHNANEQNMVMFLNLVEWLANSTELTAIRAKTVAPRPLEVIEEDQKNIVKVVNIAAGSASIVVFGIWYLRHRKRKPSMI